MNMTEEPNTKLYFNDKIARVVFVYDTKKRIHWVDISSLSPSDHGSLKMEYLQNYKVENIEEIVDSVVERFDEECVFEDGFDDLDE